MRAGKWYVSLSFSFQEIGGCHEGPLPRPLWCLVRMEKGMGWREGKVGPRGTRGQVSMPGGP